MSLRYSQEEHELMAAAFAEGVRDPEIVSRLNRLPSNIERGVVRSVPSVHSRRRAMGLLRNPRMDQMEADPRDSDASFREAMRLAISLGKEHAHEGVVQDPTPFVGRMIHPEPYFSGCSSSAALCAEAGDTKGALEPV